MLAFYSNHLDNKGISVFRSTHMHNAYISYPSYLATAVFCQPNFTH